MNFTDKPVPEKDLRSFSVQVQFSDISLHELLKEELVQQQGETNPHHLILRCEALPVVKGEPNLLRQFMRQLVKMILPEDGISSRTFLHVNCQEIAHADNGHAFEIRFQSNRIGNAAWKNRHRNEISFCQQVISLHGGSFEVQNINKADNVFSLILPGKLQ